MSIIYRKKVFLTIIFSGMLFSFVLPMQAYAQLNETILNTINRIANTGSENSQSLVVEPVTLEGLSDSMLYSTLAGIKKAPEPFVYGKYFVFTFAQKQAQDRDHVMIAFEHELYSKKHTMVRLQANPSVLVYLLPRTHEDQRVNYKFIINNMWAVDPSNKTIQIDSRGIQISTVYIPKLNPLFLPPIVKIDNTTIRFYLYLKPTQIPIKNTQRNLINIYDGNFYSSNIFLVGSFSNWDPYTIKMQQDPKNPQLYYADISTKPGIYYYYYNGGTVNFLDPQNEQVAKRKASGSYVNSFEIISSIKESSGESVLEISTMGISSNR